MGIIIVKYLFLLQQIQQFAIDSQIIVVKLVAVIPVES